MSEKQKVTMYDLARELGVSIAAVSRAFDPSSKLKEEKRRLILETADKYDYRPNKMASRLSMRPIRIGVFSFSAIREFYGELLSGIQSAYGELRDFKVECQVVEIARNDCSLQEALCHLDQMAEQGLDGLILSGIYEPEALPHVRNLIQKGIRVASLQYDLGTDHQVFVSTGDYETHGAMAAQLCGMLLRNGDRRETVMFTGNQASPTHRMLTKAFKAAAQKYGIALSEVYDTKDDPQRAENLVRTAFEKHPDLSAIYVSSANSLPICRYLEETGKSHQIALVTSDVFSSLRPYLENGCVDATIYQEPFKIGYDAFRLLYRIIAEGAEVEPVIRSTPRIVLSSNLAHY